MKRMRRRIGWVLTVLCMMVSIAAKADIQAEMKEGEWSWEANGTSMFSGVIRTDGADISGAELHLAVETGLEDSGEVLFTNVNDKKLKVRKRSDTVSMDIAGGNADNTFEAEWFLPSDVAGGLAAATFRLTVSDAEGKEIGQAVLNAGSSEMTETVLPAVSPVRKAEQLIRYLLIACAAVWLAAFGRHIFLNRKVKSADQ